MIKRCEKCNRTFNITKNKQYRLNIENKNYPKLCPICYRHASGKEVENYTNISSSSIKIEQLYKLRMAGIYNTSGDEKSDIIIDYSSAKMFDSSKKVLNTMKSQIRLLGSEVINTKYKNSNGVYMFIIVCKGSMYSTIESINKEHSIISKLERDHFTINDNSSLDNDIYILESLVRSDDLMIVVFGEERARYIDGRLKGLDYLDNPYVFMTTSELITTYCNGDTTKLIQDEFNIRNLVLPNCYSPKEA